MESDKPALNLGDLVDAHMLAAASPGGDAAVFIDRKTGRMYWRYEEDVGEPIPPDVEDSTRYARVPDHHGLDFDSHPKAFTRQHLPALYGEVEDIFRRRGAYRRFTELLERADALDAWYAYRDQGTERALREWAGQEGFTVIG